ncbi:helix-turn-helix domain-containing protein [Pseudomonas sp. Au-Pse12]|jgi:transcriptional regulator with XRE-family HTH domain|uniref:helix-turn-helix domain-containing protein n=1 Tax=Pseudomonas sp. Au-Pse12 TaxID=2906459 RepID=UPI001E4CF09F|nr:helix-turn-helix transcriptional regulator [Pseudomonas sp. Au-Pse12]MCE4054782.1 helix-turn-helix domain-containing protein [Pseudomonas sp. Au-Pse12]
MNMTLEERGALIDDIQQEMAAGRLPIGEAVKRLRTEVTGLHQHQFARMCRISLRTLIHIEHGDGNPTLKSLTAVFKPFGLQMGVVKVQKTSRARSLLDEPERS